MNKFVATTLLCTSCICSFQITHSQTSYIPYFDLVNQAEEEFVINNNSVKCFELYDSAFSKFERPFVSDMFIAAQIAYASKDHDHFIQYLSACFDRGMTFDCMHNPALFAPIFSDKVLLAELEVLYAERKEWKFDVAVHDSVFMHFYREQMIKKDIGISRDNFPKMWEIEKENVAYFNTFLEKGCFPSEQMIGLYTEASKAAVFQKYNLEPFEQPLPAPINADGKSMMLLTPIPEDYALCHNAALITYLHYPCEFDRNKDKFYKAVENGYMHMKDFCMMEEWFVQGFGNPNYLHDCPEARVDVYYNIYWKLVVSKPSEIEQVEKNRKKMHIQKLSVDRAKRKLQQENGFAFSFGFLDLR